VVFGFQWEADV
jgi:hypothetical protein